MRAGVLIRGPYFGPSAPPPGLVVLHSRLCQAWEVGMPCWSFTDGSRPRLHLPIVYEDTGEVLTELDVAELKRHYQ